MTVFLLNDSNVPIPNPMPPLARDYLSGIRRLEKRCHLEEDSERTVVIDGVPIIEVVKALTEAERAELDVYEQRVRDSLPPGVGDDIWYRFSPKGQAGCVWEMPEGHANHLLKMNPARFRVVEWEEACASCHPHRPMRWRERAEVQSFESEATRHRNAVSRATRVVSDGPEADADGVGTGGWVGLRVDPRRAPDIEG